MALFKKSRLSSASGQKRYGSPGKRCYAVGDVHGQLALLKSLIAKIEDHQRTDPADEVVVVMLGDLIDRGPDSRGVIDLLMRPLPFEARLICLRGNHEDTLVRGLTGNPNVLSEWLEHGGWECAQSYGLDRGMLAGQSAEAIEHNLASAIPGSHLRFMASFADSVRFGDYLLVHAGIRPGVLLNDQVAEDLRWIREPFLSSAAEHGFVVVHGHSITLEVEDLPNRIGIDTGAYKTGVLTAVWLEDDRKGFLQASEVNG